MTNRKRLRLSLFLPSFAGGGAERVMIGIANDLVSRKYEIDFVVGCDEGVFREEINPTINVINLNRSRMLSNLWPLVRYFRTRRPLACLSSIMHANVICASAARLSCTDVRVVLRESGSPELSNDRPLTEGHSPMLRLARLVYPRADAVVAVSTGILKEISETLKLPSDLTQRVILNPVDFNQLSTSARKPATSLFGQSNNDDLKIISVGRLSPEKGYDTLVRAVARVAQTTPIQLLLLGEGPQRDTLQQLAHDLGVTQLVYMPGFVRNPFPHILEADIFISSSYSEGMPNALIQAMGLGKKTLCTKFRNGPLPDISYAGRPSSISPDDPIAMAKSIIHLSQQPDWDNPPNDWYSRFSAAKIVDSYLKLLIPETTHTGNR